MHHVVRAVFAGQAVAMKRMGIEGSTWAAGRRARRVGGRGSGARSRELSAESQCPTRRRRSSARCSPPKQQSSTRSRMTDEQRKATPAVDFRPFIIADADTGHGGDAARRNLIRRFVEAGVPGYHIEDQKPGVKKCGHQGGKVLVSGRADQAPERRALPARHHAGGRHHRRAHRRRVGDLLDGRSDERDQPFILGATNFNLPTFKVAFLAILRRFNAAGIEELTGHQLYATSEDEYAAADAWLERTGSRRSSTRRLATLRDGGATPRSTPRSTRSSIAFVDAGRPRPT